MEQGKRILIQACCGPCAIAACTDEWADQFEFIEFFFNGDNFDSRTEYLKRKRALDIVMRTFLGRKLVCVDKYMPVEFMSCEHCIEYRLRRTAEVAGFLGFDCFATTLTVSPHKSAEMINKIGQKVAIATGMPYVETNFKKNDGFKRTVEISKELGLYRQNYCGCKRSMLK